MILNVRSMYPIIVCIGFIPFVAQADDGFTYGFGMGASLMDYAQSNVDVARESWSVFSGQVQKKNGEDWSIGGKASLSVFPLSTHGPSSHLRHHAASLSTTYHGWRKQKKRLKKIENQSQIESHESPASVQKDSKDGPKNEQKPTVQTNELDVIKSENSKTRRKIDLEEGYFPSVAYQYETFLARENIGFEDIHGIMAFLDYKCRRCRSHLFEIGGGFGLFATDIGLSVQNTQVVVRSAYTFKSLSTNFQDLFIHGELRRYSLKFSNGGVGAYRYLIGVVLTY